MLRERFQTKICICKRKKKLFLYSLPYFSYKADLYYVERKVPKKEKEKTKYVIEKRKLT